MTAGHAVSFEDLVDYAIGELPADREQFVDEHLFECEACTTDLEWLSRTARGIAHVVTEGRVGVTGTLDLVEHLRRRGVPVRHYTIRPGEAVQCTAAPDDAFVAVALAELPAQIDAVTVHIEFEDVETAARQEPPPVILPVDAPSRQAVVLYPGRLIRTYPRSRWTMRTSAATESGTTELASYVLDHTPWEQLTPDERQRM